MVPAASSVARDWVNRTVARIPRSTVAPTRPPRDSRTRTLFGSSLSGGSTRSPGIGGMAGVSTLLTVLSGPLTIDSGDPWRGVPGRPTFRHFPNGDL